MDDRKRNGTNTKDLLRRLLNIRFLSFSFFLFLPLSLSSSFSLVGFLKDYLEIIIGLQEKINFSSE